MSKKDIDTIRNGLKSTRDPELKASDFLSTGSTILNLAISDRVNGGWFKGGYFYFVGDSISGKTFICLTGLAEATRRNDFDDYDLIYDGTTENGALMNIRQFFGRKVERRLKMRNSETTDELYYTLDTLLDRGRPFIYIVDSENGLDSKQEIRRFKANKQAFLKGTEEKGSYGDKAKTHSQNLRKLLNRLRATGSLLIVVGQTRDNLNAVGWADKKTRSGGRALRFYAQLEMWSSTKEHIRKKVGTKERELGIISKVQIKKNRVKGRDRVVHIPIYHSYGIDDIGGCVDYLIEEGHWRGTKNKVTAPEFEFKGSKSKLINKIDSDDLVPELKAIVRRTWNEIEEACSIKRKRKYD